MSDRELLELAAKAAGIKVDAIGSHGEAGLYVRVAATGKESGYMWKPFQDNHAAFKLMAELGLGIVYGSWAPLEIYSVCVSEREGGDILAEECIGNNDPCWPTRLAIVRAAAEIGKQ